MKMNFMLMKMEFNIKKQKNNCNLMYYCIIMELY